ncbi:MAG TPA: HIT domain-containing protein [Bryobacteraceae bacterium]|nr:HIT domain-containing protein [Bryobacteraceae bacterium]
MDYLWTPWRYSYITKTGEQTECVFCAAAQPGNDREMLVVHRAAHNYVILNRFPYTSGHFMVVPYEHLPTLEDLPDETLTELIRLAQAGEKHLRAIYHPEGLNLGMNIGRSAGAGIAGHVHLHVLPRWNGDTNFMTAVSETRVLPEALEVTWEKLRKAYSD